MFNHNVIVSNLSRILGDYFVNSICTVHTERMDVVLDENNIFEPDIFVLCDQAKATKNAVHGAPDLVIEVLSPSSIEGDRRDKMLVYGRCGVKEYWIINPADCSVEIYLPDENESGGRFFLHAVYWLADTPSDQKVVDRFHTVLFSDLEIKLADVFAKTRKEF
jgi:Uma2 family endonuclease